MSTAGADWITVEVGGARSASLNRIAVANVRRRTGWVSVSRRALAFQGLTWLNGIGDLDEHPFI
jgi:hypothetical protein